MVLLGLVLGVIFAVIVAAHGCSGGKKRTFHGTREVPSLTARAGVSGSARA
jgi:uncharacterized membrane protein